MAMHESRPHAVMAAPPPRAASADEWRMAYWMRKCGVPPARWAAATEPPNAHDVPVADWVDRCAARLGQLQPYISPVQALARAIELHEERQHIRPETAAELEFSDWPRRR
jgi:hypothetical protein